MSPIQKTLLLLPLAAGAALANSGGPLAGLAGAPGEADCTSCHGSSIGGGAVRVELVPAGLSYTPSQTLRVRVTVEDPTAVIWGFQITARNASNTAQAAGRLSSISSDTRVQTEGGVDFLSQTSSGTRRGTRTTAAWEFYWTALASGSNRVVFYAVGLAANGNGSESGGAGSGDKSYRA